MLRNDDAQRAVRRTIASRRKRSKAVPFNAADIVNIAKSNPYIERLIEDPKLRKNVTTALNSTKSAYERLNNGRVHPQALLEDKKLHADLGKALTAARDATITLVGTQRRRRRGLRFGRLLMLATVGSVVALVASEGMRSKVLDLLFGAEEEFQYTPPAASSSSSQNAPVGAA
jgi:hypothetical protein